MQRHSTYRISAAFLLLHHHHASLTPIRRITSSSNIHNVMSTSSASSAASASSSAFSASTFASSSFAPSSSSVVSTSIPPSQSQPQQHQYTSKKVKRSQKRSPPPPAGSGAHYTFTSRTQHNPPLRHVTPYRHDYSVFVKKRWIGKELGNVLVQEFKLPSGGGGEEDEGGEEDGDETEDTSSSSAAASDSSSQHQSALLYYRHSLSTGKIRVNDKLVTESYVLNSGDHITHQIHKHEPPVVAEENGIVDAISTASSSSSIATIPSSSYAIPILHSTSSYVAVNKPCSLPVHECGVYRHNTMLGILWNQPPYVGVQLYPVHRLDKVTSGVVILAKSSEAAAKMGKWMKFDEKEEDESVAVDLTAASSIPPTLPTKSVSKQYLALVRGRFPTSIDADSPRGLSVYPSASTSAASDSSSSSQHQYPQLLLSAPILTVSLRKGIHAIDFTRGKTAMTIFSLIRYDPVSNTSLISAEPLTGRTHQIRLHLQYLDKPIVNDPVYCGENDEEGGAYEGNTYTPISVEEHPDQRIIRKETDDGVYDPECRDCTSSMYYRPMSQNQNQNSGLRYCTGIYLHALEYTIYNTGAAADDSTQQFSSSSFTTTTNNNILHRFTSPLPIWAREGFDVVKALGKRVKTSRRAVNVMKEQEEVKMKLAATTASSMNSPSAATSSSSTVSASSSSSSSSSSSASITSPITIRAALPSDVPSITRIYSHWVLHGTGTFETAPPSESEMMKRFAALSEAGMPYLVAVTSDAESRVVGYVYANQFRPREAYRWTLENSLYVDPLYAGRDIPNKRVSIGKLLLAALLDVCRTLQYTEMLAVIGDAENHASIGLHTSYGFVKTGEMKNVGFKFGRWLDVVIMQYSLQPRESNAARGEIDPPKKFLPSLYQYNKHLDLVHRSVQQHHHDQHTQHTSLATGQQQSAATSESLKK